MLFFKETDSDLERKQKKNKTMSWILNFVAVVSTLRSLCFQVQGTDRGKGFIVCHVLSFIKENGRFLPTHFIVFINEVD